MQAIKCGTLIDGVSTEPISDAIVLIEDGFVQTAGPREEVSIPDDATHVNHSDAVVTPGLIDAHVHLYGYRQHDPAKRVVEDHALTTARGVADLRRLLESGFTAVRDLGSRTGIGLGRAVVEGTIPGPRVYSSGLALSQTAGHGDIHELPHEWVQNRGGTHGALADGADECRREARKRVRQGADVLKLQTTGGVMSEQDASEDVQYTPAEISAITDEAHRAGLPAAAHAQGEAGVKLALRNGVDTIEHACYLDAKAIDLLLEREAVVVPTLVAIKHLAEQGEAYGYPEYGVRKAKLAAESHIESIRRAYEAGVPIAMGTDFTGIEPNGPHGGNAIEAELYVTEIGMSEMDAVKAATSVAANAIGDNQIGAITEGKLADMIVLDADPLADIQALREVNTVYKAGKRVTI